MSRRSSPIFAYPAGYGSPAAPEPDALAWAAPASTSRPSGSTSGDVTWATPTGGVAPYTYSSVGVAFDSQTSSSTLSLSTAGTDPGVTTASGLVNGQTVVLQRTVTDSEGAIVRVQAVITVGAAAATLTFASAPANQSLVSTATSATIGTWGAASGGTGPYTYALTELSGGGTTITGSGLGSYSASGFSAGSTYAFLMTATDSLGAKGYSVVTVSVAEAENLGQWEVVDEVDFSDGDWAPFSSTATTSSSTSWYATLMAADGVTPRCYLFSNDGEGRTASMEAAGFKLVNGTSTATPAIGFWPPGWEPLLGGARQDAWLIEAVVDGEEPGGTSAFTHFAGISTSSTTLAASPGTGVRVTETGSSARVQAASYISGLAQTAYATLAGSPRAWSAAFQVTIVDSRRHDVFATVGATDFCEPMTGARVRVQATSTSMTAVGADVASDGFTWFGTTIAARTKFWLYHNGTATTGASIRLKKLRLLKMPRGSLL